jgi:5'-methylthioadenosine phosphorylase
MNQSLVDIMGGSGLYQMDDLQDALARAVRSVLAADADVDGVALHQSGTYVCIESLQFSGLAESNWYRAMGASVVGMTNMPEAKLVREAQIAYTTLATAPDVHERLALFLT